MDLRGGDELGGDCARAGGALIAEGGWSESVVRPAYGGPPQSARAAGPSAPYMSRTPVGGVYKMVVATDARTERREVPYGAAYS